MKQSSNKLFGTILIVALVTTIIVAWVAMNPKTTDCDQGYELTEDSLVTLEDSVHFYEDGL